MTPIGLRPRFNLFIHGLSIALALSLGCLPMLASAEQTLRSFRSPIKANLQTDLSRPGEDAIRVSETGAVDEDTLPAKTSPLRQENDPALTGRAFTATLPDTVTYKGKSLPAGTTFQGVVKKTHPSRHFNRAGYVILEVQTVTLPGGQPLSIGPDTRNGKVHNPNSPSFIENVITQLPFTAASSLVSIPLKAGADLGSVAIAPINVAVRAATGAVWGLFNPKLRDKPKPERVSYGISQGLGVLSVNRFLGILPEPNFHPNDTIPLYFSKSTFLQLFDGVNSTPGAQAPVSQ